MGSFALLVKRLRLLGFLSVVKEFCCLFLWKYVSGIYLFLVASREVHVWAEVREGAGFDR